MFSSAIDGMFMPRIARIAYRDKNMDEIFNLMLKVGRFQYHLIGLILVGFISVGRQFVSLWIGEEYMLVYPCAILLLFPSPFYMSQQIGKNTMVMTNKVRYLTYVNVIKAVGNIILVSVLSVYWGVIGACASICIFYLFRNIANMILFKTKLGLDMKAFCIKCYGRMTVALLLTAAAGLAIARYNPVSGWSGMVISAVLIIVIYFILMWLIAYNRQEKDYIRRIIIKLKGRVVGRRG